MMVLVAGLAGCAASRGSSRTLVAQANRELTQQDDPVAASKTRARVDASIEARRGSVRARSARRGWVSAAVRGRAATTGRSGCAFERLPLEGGADTGTAGCVDVDAVPVTMYSLVLGVGF